MKISDRDKKLIMIVALLAIILLPIFLFIKPKKEEIATLDANLVTLNERLSYLKDLDSKRSFYEGEIVRLNTEREDMIKCYAQGIRQDNTIMFLRDIELSFPIGMFAETFGDYVRTPVTNGTYNTETGQLEGDLTALTTSTTVTYSCEYEKVKEFLNFIFTYSDKMSISGISMSYDPENGYISGNFVLNEFAFVGSGRSVEPAKIPELQRGNEAIFASILPITEEELEEDAEAAEDTEADASGDSAAE